MNENIIYALEKIASIYKVLLIETGKENKLSPTQILILEFLSKNREEENTLTNISKEFDLKKSTISDSVNNLIKKGYITKEICLSDNRVSILKLTEKSLKILDIYKSKLKKIFSIIDSLKENEKNIILKFLSELIKSLYEKNIIQKARLCLTCGNLRKIENEEKPFYCELGKIKFDYGELNFNCENYNLK